MVANVIVKIAICIRVSLFIGLYGLTRSSTRKASISALVAADSLPLHAIGGPATGPLSPVACLIAQIMHATAIHAPTGPTSAAVRHFAGLGHPTPAEVNVADMVLDLVIKSPVLDTPLSDTLSAAVAHESEAMSSEPQLISWFDVHRVCHESFVPAVSSA